MLPILIGCGDIVTEPTALDSGSLEAKSIYLNPNIEFVMGETVLGAFDVLYIGFDAELFLIPVDGGNIAMKTIRVSVDNGESHTESVDGALALVAGHHRVLLRVTPIDDRASVKIHGTPLVPESNGVVENVPIAIELEETYEFYVGTVEVMPDNTELVITWSARVWLLDLLAVPLGLDVEDGNIGVFIPQFQLTVR